MLKNDINDSKNMWQCHKTSMDHSKIIDTSETYQVAARCQGVWTENCQGRSRVWRLGGLGPALGYSLSILKTFSFAKQFWQLILENGDDCLDKLFQQFLKNKIGFNKNSFVAKKMWCAWCWCHDDAKQKITNKSNFGETLGHYNRHH